MNEKRIVSDKEKVLKAGWIVAIGLVVICFATTTLFWFNGIDSFDVSLPLMMILVFVYPIFFFFLGMYIVMKKKLFPMKKIKPQPEPTTE